MSLSTITINAVVYDVYATRDEVNEYLAVDAVRGTAWGLLTDDDDTRGPLIVAATRRLDLLNWQGEKTGDYDTQQEKWPRTGLVYRDGTPVTTTDVPQEMEDATALIAGSINLEATAADSGSSGSNTKKVQAGTAAVTFFRPQAGTVLQDVSAFELIKQWLEGFGVDAKTGNLATGTDGVSSFCDLDEFGLNRGFP